MYLMINQILSWSWFFFLNEIQIVLFMIKKIENLLLEDVKKTIFQF
jgi:hypothetical protein